MNDSASYNLQLPAPAESHFNDEAVNILGTLVPIEAPSSPGSGVESSASLRPTITVDYSQVQNARFALVKHDLLGNLKAFAFETTTGHVGLREEAFDRFEQLLTRFSERPEVRDALSRRFLESSLRAWLEMRNKDDLPESQDFVAYIRSQASHEVMNRRVDIPIDHLAIEAPFKLGNVVLRFHTREFWEELEAKTRARHPEATASSALAILRRDFQGSVIASTEVFGDRWKCIDLARTETEKVLTVLRFYSPAAFLSPLIAYFGMKGKTLLPKTVAWSWSGEAWTHDSMADDTRQPDWFVRQSFLDEMQGHGLAQAGDLVEKASMTRFEESLLSSLTTFGRATGAVSFHDKLVYFLSSAETLLLPETAEPIVTTLGLRLAFITQRDPEKRRRVDEVVRDAYRLRSNYLHHGRLVHDYEMLTEFQGYVWTALRNALVAKDRFSSPPEFIAAIRGIIYS